MESEHDPVVAAISALASIAVTRGQLRRTGNRWLRWIEAGTASPTVILVAGAGETALDFASVIPALAERFRVVAYDRAGLGASDVARPLTIESQAEDLSAVLMEVGPAVLVGHSWGGILVQLVARTHPDRILGLVLVDSFHEDLLTVVSRPLKVASATVLGGIVFLKSIGLFGPLARTHGRRLAAICSDDPGTRSLIVSAYLTCYAKRHHVATIRSENRLANKSLPWLRRARRALPLPDVPVTVLSATRGKPATLARRSTELAEQVAASVQRGRHVNVPESGHYIHHDQPATVVAAVITMDGQYEPPPITMS